MAEHRPPSAAEDALAVRAKHHERAFAELWAGRRDDVYSLAGWRAAKKGVPELEGDARSEAYLKFTEAVYRYNPEAGHFWTYARAVIWYHIDRWFDGQRRFGNRHPESDPDGPTPGTETDGGVDPVGLDFGTLVDSFRDLADRIEPASLRLKWTACSALRVAGYTRDEIATALAFASADLPLPDPSLAVRWEFVADRLRLASIPHRPPPVPKTWEGCVSLFCPQSWDGVPPEPADFISKYVTLTGLPWDDVPPEPPVPAEVKDAKTREAVLKRWKDRFGKTFEWRRIERHRLPSRS